jgi:hypothetical protein
LATSTTKSEADGTVKVYATLRFAGDELEPREISDVLGVEPTRAYRKGERYFAGPRTGELRGRTGIWLLSTEHAVSGSDLDRHLSYLANLVFKDEPGRAAALSRLTAGRHLKAHVSCFWHGRAGAPIPTIPPQVTEAFRQLPAEIETDFDTD